jgi:hypothetical protein
MRKRGIIAVIMVIVFILSNAAAFAAIDKVPGVPKNATFVYSLLFNAAQKEAMGKYYDMVINNPEFDKVAKKFAEDAGTEFPKGLFDKVKNLTSLTLAAFPNEKNIKDEPVVVVLASFDNDKAPVEIMDKLKVKFTEISKKEGKEIVFTDAEENGVKVCKVEAKDKSKDHMKNKDVKFFMSGATLGMLAQNKDKDIFKDVVTALKDDKESIAASAKFKTACEKAGKDITSIMFFDTEILKKIDDREQQKFADAVNYIALGGFMADDLSRVTTSGVISLNEAKDEETKKALNIAKMLIGGIKRSAHPSIAMPADVIMFLDLKLNLSKDLFKLPELASAPAMLMMAGISLDEDILSWLDGEIFVAIGDIANPKEVREKSIIPNVYLGLKSNSEEKAGKLVEKLLALAKSSPGAPEAKDDTVAGIKVKTLPLQGTPFKDAALVLGQIGGHYMIATSKAAFEKAAGAVAKKETSLAENVEFKTLSVFDAASFMSYFMDSEKLTKIASEFGPMKDQPKANEFLKYLAANASLQGNDIIGSLIMKTDMSKITPEMVSQFLKDVLEKSKNKKPADEPKIETPKGPEAPEKNEEPRGIKGNDEGAKEGEDETE